MYAILAWRFPIWNFFSVALSESMDIFDFGPSLNPSNSFPTLLIHSAFLLCSLPSHILLQNCLFPCHPIASRFSCIFSPLAGNFFHCFGMSCYVCIVSSCLDIFFVFLPSPVLSDLFPQVVLCVLHVLLFSFLSAHVPVFSLCLIIFA